MILLCPTCRKDWPLSGKAEGDVWVCACGSSLRAPPVRPFHAPVWHCGSCGGSSQAGATECRYCGSGFTPLDGKAFCPRCMAYLTQGARYCSHCGAHAGDVSAIPETTSHACPRCGGEHRLIGVPVGEHHGEACPRCEGLWVSQETFARVVADFSAPERQRPRGSGLARPGAPDSERPRAYEAVVRYLPCPACGVRMARRNYLRVSGVILDLCPEHGVWLDKEELRHVADFLQEGGALRSREAESRDAALRFRHRGELQRLEKGTRISGDGFLGAHTWPAGINDRPSGEVSRVLAWIWDALT